MSNCEIFRKPKTKGKIISKQDFSVQILSLIFENIGELWKLDNKTMKIRDGNN